MQIRGTVLVTYEEYVEFVSWYMKYSNIRVLKVKDSVGMRKIIDKKDKSKVAYTWTKGYDVSYGIYQTWYDIYKDQQVSA